MAKVFDIKLKGHRADSDLQEVHSRLQSKYLMRSAALADEAKAKKMEAFLRALKNLDMNNPNQDPLAQIIDDLAYQDLFDILSDATKIMNSHKHNFTSLKQMFNRVHSFKDSKRTDLAVDDIFEEELYAVLKAIEGKSSVTNIDLGVSLTGGQSTNIRAMTGKTTEEINKYLQSVIDDLVNNKGWSKRAAKAAVGKIKAVSGKVDVTGFKGEIDIQAEIDPKWQSIVEAFRGTSFTLKNYSSAAKTLELHIGNSSPYRAMHGTLTDLDFSDKESDHIYYHSLHSYKKSPTEKKAAHIYHTRLVYELTGVGLYDKNGDPIDAANFIIYNDPSGPDIFVRSTKKIIYDLIGTEKGFTGNPFKAVVLSKDYFI